jgi:hypothetical protein
MQQPAYPRRRRSITHSRSGGGRRRKRGIEKRRPGGQRFYFGIGLKGEEVA